jgi:hypothetical protein
MDMWKRPLMIVGMMLAVARPADAGGLIIGYTNVQAVGTYSPALMEQIAGFKFFFAHASVGRNIMEGLAGLNQVNPELFRLKPVAAEGVPPATTEPGTVYEFHRGNPPWQGKVDDFAGYVKNGWHHPNVDIVLDKFCYIDQDADVDYYIRSMAKLEAAYPDTVVVYMTIPLKTGTDEENYLRNVYNDNLRGWVKANNRVLFDIADMEAYDPDGTPQTFEFKGRVCQKLSRDYTKDKRHLDDEAGVGGRHVAKGFYALAAALLNARAEKAP